MFEKIFQQVTWKKTGFNYYIYDFSVDYNLIDINYIKDTQIFNEKKLHSIKMFRFLK